MSDGDDNLIKIPFRGAAPAQAATLIAAASPPPPGSWVLEVPFSDADVIPDPDEDDLAKEGNGED